MRFSPITILASLAALVSANTVSFVSQDSTDRTIVFTAQEGLEEIPTHALPGRGNVTVEFPTGWIGNFYSVSKGAENVPGMLGEISWDGWNGLNFFDISAIVNPNDKNGIKTLSPKTSSTPTSGCQSYDVKCELAYYLPEDIQTQSTLEKDLVCTVGTSQAASKMRRHPRHFVTGHRTH